MARCGLVVFLVLLGAPAQAERFSIKCTWHPSYIITFDEESKRVISETPGALTRKGVIDSATDDEIRFHMSVNPAAGGIWNRKSGSLVLLDSLNLPADKRYENFCFKSELRPVMSMYDKIEM